MALHYRTLGFFLKKNDIGEADRVFTVFTLDFGKIKILGKAIRKVTSKLRGGIDIISLSELEFIQGKTYKTLTDSVILERFEDVKKDLDKLKIGQRIVGSLDNLTGKEEKDEKLWNLLKEVFGKMNRWEQKGNLQIIYYYFLWNLFSIIGYKPELYGCVACQRKLAEGQLYFSAEEGGIVCGKCTGSKKKISTDVVKVLRIILKNNWSLLVRLKIQPVHWETLKEISEYYYSCLLSVHSSGEDATKDKSKTS